MQPFNFTPAGKKPPQATEPMNIDAWMNQNAGGFDHPMHPNTRRFLSGPNKGRTPEQVATKLAEQHTKGLATPMGAIGHGAAGGLDTPTMAMSQADWKARFHAKPAAAAPVNTETGLGDTLKKIAGSVGSFFSGANPATIQSAPKPLAQKPSPARAPAAPVTSTGIPGVKTMSNKYGSGSSYDARTFTPAVATPPVDPLAPALKQNFFA